MNSFLKKIVPGRWKATFRDYIQTLVRSEQKQQSSIFEERINNIQLHMENITGLITSTTNNLDTVGKNLENIHEGIVAQMTELGNRQQTMNKQLKQQEVAGILLYTQLPEVLIYDDATVSAIEDFKKQFKVDFDFNKDISKNDIMFLYSLATYKSLPVACHNYFTIGYNGFTIVRDFIKHIYPLNDFTGNILDFASGYGRVTRFLAGYFGAANVTTSDIKSEAVDFQKNILQVKGFYSSYIPADLVVNESFGVIFVGSLFSHLNEILFYEWLLKLLSLLSTKGYLLFTVHDHTLHPQQNNESYQYVEDNEDEKFEFIQNRITSTTLYGISFVSEVFVKEVLEKINPEITYKRYPKTFGGHQDLYIASLGGKMPSPDFQFQ